MAVIELPPHVDRLGAQPATEKDDLRANFGRFAGHNAHFALTGGHSRQFFRQIGTALEHQRRPLRKVGTPGIGRITEVSQIDFWMLSQICAIAGGQRTQRFLTFGRKGQQMEGLRVQRRCQRGAGFGDRRYLAQHQMNIRSAQTKGADPGNARGGGPGHEGGRHLDRPGPPVDQRVGGVEVDIGRDHAMLDRQDRFDQRWHPGRGIQVTHIRCHRAEPEWRAPFAKDIAEGINFHRITEWGANAIRFDIADGLGRYPSIGQGLPDHCLLGTAIRHRQPTRWPIMVGGAAQDDGQNRVAIALRIPQPLEDQKATAFAQAIAIGRGVKSFAAPIASQQLPLTKRRHNRGIRQ